MMIMMITIFMSCLLYYRAKQQNEVPPPPIQPTVSEHYYSCIFNTKLNFGFGTPRSDTCIRCHQLAIDAADGPEKDSLEKRTVRLPSKSKSRVHNEEEGQTGSQGKLEQDEETRQTHSFCSIDSVDMVIYFEQTLPTPNLLLSELFYMQQLWVYNFRIHNCVSDVGDCVCSVNTQPNLM